MSGVVPVIPRFRFNDSAGNPLALGSVTVYLAGTSTLARTYQDSGLTTANTNPVNLDANGECLFWVDPTYNYKFLLTTGLNGTGSTVSGWPVDNIPGAAGRNAAEVTPQEYGADNTGGTSCVTAFQSALTAISARTTGRKLRVPSGTYLFTVTGDSDTIQIPSNCEIECDPGVVFKWGYWGSPLFAIVNKANVKMALNGAKFVWTGTFGTTSGSSDKFSYGRAIPAYEWCAHIVGMGCSFVEIEGGRCEGETTANMQNCFLSFRGTAAGGLCEGNQVRKLLAHDVCQGIAWSEQSRFVLDEIEGGRYSNVSAGLYGPGHLVYVTAGTTTSENGSINVKDNADSALSAFDGAAHSVSLKKLKNSKVKVFSRRDAGAVNMVDLENVEIDVHYNSASTDDNSAGLIGMTSDPAVANKYVTIRGTVIQDAQRNAAALRMDSVTAGSKNLYCDVDLTVVRTGDGTESLSAVNWVGNYGVCRVRHQNIGSGAARAVVNVLNTSTNSNFYVSSSGAVSNPRVVVAAGTNNTFWCSGDSTIDFDTDEFTPATGNAIVWESARQYISSKSLGTGANPTGTFQLPKPGAYLVHINVITSDANHARSGLYWVVFDDAGANDFTTSQLIGTQISKGGSAPTVLSLAVDKDGLCTVTSTAASNTFNLRYGYRQLAAD